MNRWGTTVVLLILAGAAVALRWPALEQRPLHNDEAVNAIKFGELWEKGNYRYDPHEYHGPTLHYATWALDETHRQPSPRPLHREPASAPLPSSAASRLILLLPLFKGGTSAIPASSGPPCSSPFHRRWFFTAPISSTKCCWSSSLCWRLPPAGGIGVPARLGWALLAGAALGGMHATKETFVITLGCATMALAANLVLES